ncbi:TonB-dependent receptor [Cupriavidus sp. USMAA2-4]|uniref:TonB-dependent receptor n=1 Tax=Cupriavidus sp. USMAA2-4 TaxID=876364 RepID=UPI0008A67441|nr:TonB-dependent receptor [Cupriavidus sp. USMAA2-4]AOY92451.1 TonB-dependent receptor [Cupriavidus sp. USMAA2-4]
MSRFPLRALAAGAASAFALAAQAQSAPPAPASSASSASTNPPALPAGDGTPPPDSKTLNAVVVSAKRLDEARNKLSPETGSSVYRFDKEDIAALPQGDNTALNQVLLQAPGVTQDSFGQLHVRGDHANLQYRINGVIVPEPISGFGQMLDTRFADQVSLITGALPAQYGYRTAGIIDIRTKGAAAGGEDEETPPKPFGGEIGTVIGSHGDREVNAQVQGTAGRLSYYLSGSFIENNLGIENPTGSRNAIHDHTDQGKAFGMLSYLIDPDQRVSFVFGNANNRFEIPNRPGLTPAFTLDGAVAPSSASLNASQREKTDFQILSYQNKVSSTLDYQVSLFHRTSRIDYNPDPIGDLVYNGVASNIMRSNEAYGMQADASYALNGSHTLRSGLFVQYEHAIVNNTSSVFPADADGNQTSSAPFSITDNGTLGGTTMGFYLQDEWKATDKLTVNYGARYDHVNTVVSEQQLSPRLGLTYELSHATRLHAGYARYFTPPPTELIDTTSVAAFQGTTNALPSGANTSVRSERSNYFDLGISHQATRNLTLGLDAYYRDVRHLQDEGQFGNALIFSSFNYARGRIYGLEGTANYRQGNFGAYANLALSRAMAKGIESGQFNFSADELAYIANNWVHLDHDQTVSGSFGASYLWRGTQFSGDALFGSGLRNGFANTTHLPGYFQVNVGVAHTFDAPVIGKLKTRFSIVNLFDRSYALRDGTGIGVGAPQYAPRRSFYLALSKPF